MRYKLVAIDMDGTLLNSNNKISNRTRQAIGKASEKGVKIVFATGRILKSAMNYSEELELNKPIIASNGAIIVDEFKKTIYKRPMNMDIVSKLIDVGADNAMYYHFYDDLGIYSNIYIEDVIRFYNTDYAKQKGNEIIVNIFEGKEEILNRKDLDVYKFLFLDEDKDKLINLRQQLSQLSGVNVCSSWNNNIEVMDKDVSKGNSLKYLCSELGIDSQEVIAIGDNENDLSMIDYAGLGIAMANGEDLIKSSADIITSSNDEDGVAQIIEKFILNIGDEQ